MDEEDDDTLEQELAWISFSIDTTIWLTKDPVIVWRISCHDYYWRETVFSHNFLRVIFFSIASRCELKLIFFVGFNLLSFATVKCPKFHFVWHFGCSCMKGIELGKNMTPTTSCFARKEILLFINQLLLFLKVRTQRFLSVSNDRSSAKNL